jgi:hypothetical protein
VYDPFECVCGVVCVCVCVRVCGVSAATATATTRVCVLHGRLGQVPLWVIMHHLHLPHNALAVRFLTHVQRGACVGREPLLGGGRGFAVECVRGWMWDVGRGTRRLFPGSLPTRTRSRDGRHSVPTVPTVPCGCRARWAGSMLYAVACTHTSCGGGAAT